MKLLRVVEINKTGGTDEPVQYVCYHPIAEARMRRGETVEPNCCAVDYEFETFTQEVFEALGWQGGVWDEAIKEIKKLREAHDER